MDWLYEERRKYVELYRRTELGSRQVMFFMFVVSSKFLSR